MESSYDVFQSTPSPTWNGFIQRSVARFVLITEALFISLAIALCTFCNGSFNFSIINIPFYPLCITLSSSFAVGSMVQQTFEGKKFPDYDWSRILR